jgi:hypothetical protein
MMFSMAAKGKSTTKAEIAFYYPGPIWHGSDWIKTMILFFDGIGILLPNYMHGKLEHEDPAITLPLKDKGLLHVLEPEKIVDKKATQKLSRAIDGILDSGALDKLPKDLRFHEISYSRLGAYGDQKLAQELLARLKAKGLAKDSEDGVSIPMHPMARYLVLVLLAQILRSHGPKLGAELSPATDRPDVMQALEELLSLPDSPSAAHVVSLDLETVSVDLRLVPMDEVLGFRKEYFKEHRAYVRSVRKLTRDLAQLPVEEREEELKDRRDELQAIANDLKTVSRKAWRRPAGFALGMAGAFWKLKGNDYMGTLLAAAGAVVALKSKEKADTGAYSYLFRAQTQRW